MNSSPEIIDSVVLMSQSSMTQKSGEMPFTRDGTAWEASIRIETGSAGSLQTKALTQADPPFDRAVALKDGRAVDSGRIVAIERIEEDTVAVRVDSVLYDNPEAIN